MSEIQVGQINSTDGSTAITTGADGYVSFAKTQIGGRRNLIINGAMQVAQRGTSATSVTSSQFLVDRFDFVVTSAGTWTISQSTDSPDGFSNSFKAECTTADASLSASDECRLETRLEGQDLQHLQYGVSSAQTMTLTFWVKSNKTGTATVWLYADDTGNRQTHSYTISSANTWEQKTITISPDTASSIDNDNGTGFRVGWYLAGGTTYQGALTSTWASGANPRLQASDINFADSTSNYINITGVQLEVGTVATPFEHRSYGEELALCQRYYVASMRVYPTEYSGAGLGNFYYPVTLRTNPTFDISTNPGGASVNYGTTGTLSGYIYKSPYDSNAVTFATDAEL